ncbi:MAG: 50S ribosomal protein L30e [Candidatus Micrarchaeia archaeon]
MEDDEKIEAAEEPAEETEMTEEQTEEAPAKEKKQKKVVRRRKSKKERENPLTTAVRLAVESGKVEFGARTGLAAVKAKLFVTASNTPKETKESIEKLAKSSNIPLIEFEGSTMELGSVCGKPFPVSLLSIFEEGSSNIMELAKKK